MRRWLCTAILLLLSIPAIPADAPLRAEGAPRIVAFADVHGAHAELLSLLRAAGVVDEAARWSGGRTHLVSLGDLLDRGPESRRVLDLLMRLEGEASAAGGALHLVLGNHEVMNLAGDLRYVSEAEYAAFAGGEDEALREAAWQRLLARSPQALRTEFDERHPAGWFAHRQAFSPAGRYGSWLLSKPFVVVVDDTAFAHGGLPPMIAELGLERANEALRAQLAAYLEAWRAIEAGHAFDRPVGFQERPDALAALGAAAQAESLRAMQSAAVFTTGGPTWYRGQALCHPFVEEANLEAVLSRLGAARLVAGHTVLPTRRTQSRFGGRVLLLDTGMLRAAYRGVPSAWVLEGDDSWVLYAGPPPERATPETPARRVGPRPAALDDDALEAWLAEAEILGVEELDTGITEPRRVTLRKDGVELRAVFKQLSTDFGATSFRQALDNADRFQYEVAAYRLDRLLGLDLVPVTVPRTVGGRRGVLQFWIDGAINARQMLEAGMRPEGWCDIEPQYNLMNVFDVLIHNTDRTQENLLLTRDWNLVLIDHSRAFATTRSDPPLLYKGELLLPEAFARRLEALDRETLESALSPWIHRRQVEALLDRRDRLLDRHRARPGIPAAAGR